MNKLVERAIESLKARRERELRRCAQACFCDDQTGELTLEGQRLLSDLRDSAKLFNSGIRKDARGAIDPLELVRMEGRREILLRLLALLERDPISVARIVEVDDGTN